MQLAVNHLGHFLLTSLLLPLMTDPQRCFFCKRIVQPPPVSFQPAVTLARLQASTHRERVLFCAHAWEDQL